ncbi:hypothetical protein [Pseudomonas sp. PWP3-1b2]|uniref:hypothetical protein n=1 Tax=Pseudomonas sp. PWP3-1b2 TaxID=2804656 RepID=UPI003CEF9F9E
MSSYISARAAVMAGNATLNRPTVDEWLDPVSGLISTADANVGINLNCEVGQFTEDLDWIEVQLLDRSHKLPNWVTIYGPEQFFAPASGNSISINIEASSFSGGFEHGSFELRYMLYVNKFADPLDPADVDRPSDSGEFSRSAPWVVDRHAPYARASDRDQPTVAQYTGSLPAGAPVTASSLAADSGLPFTVPPNTYPIPSGQWAVGDTVHCYWANVSIPLPQYELDVANTPRLIPETGTTFTVPVSAVTGSGTWYFFYTLTDRAGNVSRPSAVTSFNVALLPAPEQKDLFIPLAPAPEGGSLDRLLNVADYVSGISAELRTFLNHQPTLDQVRLKWGAQPWTAPVALTAFPFIFTRAALDALIVADYGTRKGPQPTDVQYRIVRNGEDFDSLIKTVDVDLSVAGPGNGGDPGSVNTRLIAAQIFGESSIELNTLRASHATKPVTVSVVLWSGQDVPQPGQFIIFVRPDGSPVVPGFALGSQLAGTAVTFTVPWADVAVNGNGPQTVGYFIASSATPAATDNRNVAPTTSIDIIDAVIENLKPPVFVGAVGAGANMQWTCDALPKPTYQGQITIPAESRMVVGQQLTLSLRIFRPRTGALQADSTRVFSVTITPEMLTKGHTFIVPWDFIRTAQRGTGEATITAPLTGGVIGRGFISRFIRSVLSETSCDLTPP